MRPFRNMPIAQKLTAIIMLVTAAALVFSGIALIVSDVVLFRSHLRRDLSALARIVADNSTAALAFEDPQSAAETLAQLKTRTHLTVACIYRADATLLARYSRSDAAMVCPAPAAGPEQVQFSSAAVTVSQPITLRDRRIGTFVLIYDLDEMYERIRLYGAMVLAVLVASSLIAFVLSAKLRSIIATPISELAQATASVSRTRDYSTRAPKLSNDELGVLVDGFNEMLASIQSRDKELMEALLARETALMEARTARDFLRTTLASIGDAVISTDSEGRTVFANPVACRLMGCEESEIAGRRLDEVLCLVNEQTRSSVESPVSRVLREGATVGLANHTILIARDGREIPIDDSASPIRDQKGELTGAVLIFRDITDRRRAEQELRAAREQLQLVTDTMAPAVSYCSRELKYIWVSRRFAEWQGCSPEALAGRPILDVVGAEALAAIRPHYERALAGERVEYEARVNYSSIGLRWIRAIYVPTHDQTGAVSGWVADVSDITALKNAEAEVLRVNADLQRTNERLARSNEDLERFAFVASHDLQEPLRMITMYAQFLGRTQAGQVDQEAGSLVRNIVDATKRMRELLVDLLAYTELAAEPDEPAGTVDMNFVVAEVMQNLKASIDETGAIVTSDALPRLTVHEAHFIPLLQNLIGNAIKYRSELAPRIHISVEQTDGQLQFSITDNGIGIEPEYHEKIFGVFKRLHGRKIPGTGVGLAICQRVVERYGGRIWVESQPAQGSVFRFTIPDRAVAVAERA